MTSFKALVWYANARHWHDDDENHNVSILILGGSGGTGSLGIQLSKHFGADEIITTTSAANANYVMNLGATRVIDYHIENWYEVLEDYSIDVIYDCVGQSGTADHAMRKLGKNGFFVTIAGALSDNTTRTDVKQSFFINSDTNLVGSSTLLEEISSLNLSVGRIFAQYPLSELDQAFNLSRQGHVVGKISIAV